MVAILEPSAPPIHRVQRLPPFPEGAMGFRIRKILPVFEQVQVYSESLQVQGVLDPLVLIGVQVGHLLRSQRLPEGAGIITFRHVEDQLRHVAGEYLLAFGKGHAFSLRLFSDDLKLERITLHHRGPAAGRAGSGVSWEPPREEVGGHYGSSVIVMDFHVPGAPATVHFQPITLSVPNFQVISFAFHVTVLSVGAAERKAWAVLFP